MFNTSRFLSLVAIIFLYGINAYCIYKVIVVYPMQQSVIVANQENILENQNAVFDLLKGMGTTNYITMDTESRIMHYVIPHKSKIQGCPECHEYWAHHQYLKRSREQGTDDPDAEAKKEIEEMEKSSQKK